MGTPDPIKVAMAFVEQINGHDVDGICGLMTTDHRYIDSDEEEFAGRDTMRQVWQGFLDWFPNYTIRVTRAVADGDFVVLIGRARGTYAVGGELRPENAWDTPVVWTATVESERVATWQVYCDNTRVREIMEANAAGGS